MAKGTTILDLARKARETFDRNIDTMIAAFLIRNPEVNPGDIELVFQPSVDGKMHFWITPRVLGVKLPKDLTGEGGEHEEYRKGWHDCIDEVRTLNARTDGQMRAPIPGTPEDVEAKPSLELVK